MGLKRTSILVIEDESELADMMQNRLKDEGFSAIACGSRVDMLLKMRNQEFDVILCDLNIKGSAGGSTLSNIVGTVKDAKKKPAIIVISGNIDQNIVSEFGSEIQGAFVKPVQIDLLIKKIHSLTKKTR